MTAAVLRGDEPLIPRRAVTRSCHTASGRSMVE